MSAPTFREELRAAYREWNAHPSMESSLFIAEWAAAFALDRAAKECEEMRTFQLAQSPPGLDSAIALMREGFANLSSILADRIRALAAEIKGGT